MWRIRKGWSGVMFVWIRMFEMVSFYRKTRGHNLRTGTDIRLRVSADCFRWMLSVFHMWQLRSQLHEGISVWDVKRGRKRLVLTAATWVLWKNRQISKVTALFTWLFFWILSANSRLSAVMWHFKPLGGFFWVGFYLWDFSSNTAQVENVFLWVVKISFILCTSCFVKF